MSFYGKHMWKIDLCDKDRHQEKKKNTFLKISLTVIC